MQARQAAGCRLIIVRVRAIATGKARITALSSIADKGMVHNERRSLVYIPELGYAASVCTIDRESMLRDLSEAKAKCLR